MNNFSYDKKSFISHSLLNVFIKNAGEILNSIDYDENIKVPAKANTDVTLYKEKKALALCLSNALYPRLDAKNAKIFNKCMRLMWEDIETSYCHKIFFKKDPQFLNAPIIIEKDTAMQIDDKIQLVDISDAVLVATHKLSLSSTILFQSKVAMIVEHLKKYKNLILVGKTAYGKSTCIKTALESLKELGYNVVNRQIYINSLSNDDIFGEKNTNPNVFKPKTDGLIASILKEFNNHDDFNVLTIVGESETKDAYLYESLYNNEDMFVGQNNQKIIYKGNHFKTIWETDEISNLSPSIISLSNLIYINGPLITWHSIVESTFQIYSDSIGLYKMLKNEALKYLKLIYNEYKANKNKFDDVLPVTFESKVKFMMTIIKATIKNNDHWNENDVNSIIEYSAVYAFSAAMSLNGRKLFNEWWRSNFKLIPNQASIYEYYYDIDTHQFLLWSDTIPAFSCPPHQGIPLNVYVHTPNTMYINNLLDIMMNSDESVMIVGETGNGKTSLIQEKLHASCSGDITEVFYITINANRLTDGKYIHTRINQHLSWKHGSLYIPKGNKRMYCFIDDLQLAKIETNNKQTAIEILRQHLDSGYFYDFNHKRWQNVKNVTYISTYNSKVYSPSHSISNKVLKHFHVVAQHYPSNNDIESIFTKLLYRHIFGDTDNESTSKEKSSSPIIRMKYLQDLLKSIIHSSIDLNNKMRSIFLEKSQRSHYIFTLETLTALFRHICVSITPDCTKEQLLLLWRHECDWLYSKKLVSQVDVERYQQVFKTVIKKNFSESNYLSILNKTVFFSNLKETESGIVIAGVHISNFLTSNSKEFITDGYEPETDLIKIRNLIQISLNEFNKEQQRIQFPLYKSTLSLICRLCHTIPILGGNCCIIGDGGLSVFIIQLVASLTGYHLIHFKTSQFLYSEQVVFQQLKHRLVSSYYRAGIRGEKVMLCLTEEEMKFKEFLVYVTEFVISEEIMHLFTIEEETTILNSIRTQVIQAGLTYSKETAWELFVKNIRENIRIVILLNESSNKFQTLCNENQSLFNNLELIWIQHWDIKQLVENSYYHLEDLSWLDKPMKENISYLLAFMHLSIREHDESKSLHLNNTTFTKFVEKFKLLMNEKYKYIETSHKNVCRLLEHIQRQHSIAKKLMVQLEQENMVLEERIKSTDKMLQQIGQDMTMTEQQLKIHKSQTRKTVQLKRILPEYQTAHERNVYKTIAIVSNTKKLIQNINMQSLQELRSLQKPDAKVEEILAAVIIILKSSSADVTWQKGAKRQMANLDRFLEELQSFDEHEMNEDTIKILEDKVKRIDMDEMREETQSLNSAQFYYTEALNTLYNWIKGVIKYHSLMIKRVKPLHAKVQEIEQEVKEADQKLATLNRKSEALQARLKDLAQNFEEATVDKKEQEEKVNKMQHQLDTASELNKILSREFERNMQIYESLQERIFCLPGSCALGAGFLIYLGPYQFSFRRLMLTMHWIQCLRDRGLPLVLDSLSNVNGRTVTWQMDSLLHLLSHAKEINVASDDWKVHFASDQITNEPFIGPGKDSYSEESKLDATELKPKSNTIGIELVSNVVADETQGIIAPQSSLNKSVKISDPKVNDSILENPDVIKKEDESIRNLISHPISAVSKFSEQSAFSGIVSGNDYKKFIIALTCFLVGEDKLTDWLINDADTLEIENGTIISYSQKNPPLLYCSPKKLTEYILLKSSNAKVDLDKKDNEDTVVIEKCFQNGANVIFENCSEIDPVLLPLIFYKNSMSEVPNNEDSRLVLFSNRRLFCNPTFQLFFSTSLNFDKFSPNILSFTTPINFKPSIENLIDFFQNKLFSLLFKKEYALRNVILERIKECNQKLREIDIILKNKWEKDGFQDEEVLITKLALERKYKIGEILEYCQEFLNNLNELTKVVTPIAIRAGMLMMLSQKMYNISKNYEFVNSIIENIFNEFEKISKPINQVFNLRLELLDKQESYNYDEINQNKFKSIESQLPKIADVDDIKNGNYITYSAETIDELIKYLTNTFLNQILISILPEHRLFLLSLICFSSELEKKIDFTDSELEFLIRGNPDTHINITLSDFQIPKDKTLNWIAKDNLNDLLTLSCFPGDMEGFVIAIVSDENEWKKWYHDPLNHPMPKIEMEIENSENTEMVELNDFRKLLVHKILRPDTYSVKLYNYISKKLDLKYNSWKWNDLFSNDNYKSIIIYADKNTDILITSTINRIHQHLVTLAKKHETPVTILNCDNLNINELLTEKDKIKNGFLIIKNIHLANQEILNNLKTICHSLNESKENENLKIIMTKSFEFIVPSSLTSECLVISYDVLDTINYNENKKNKSNQLTLKTETDKAENYIFNTIVQSLNLARENSKNTNIPKTKSILVYITCLAHGLLQSRQNLICGGIQKWFSWSTTWVLDALSAIQNFNDSDFSAFPLHLLKHVYDQCLNDPLDQDYILQLLKILVSSIEAKNIVINGINLPFPDDKIELGDYNSWFIENIKNKEIKTDILQVPELLLRHYNIIKAEDFIEEFHKLWDSSVNSEKNNNNQIKPDLLYFSIKICKEKLPPILELPNNIDFTPENFFSFALYEECVLYNEQFKKIFKHLNELQKYLLMETELFPIEWKTIAFTLQFQRVPQEWETSNSRPIIHTLKTWINFQNIRYNQLCGWLHQDFKNINSINFSTIKQPNMLLNSILQQKCAKNKWLINEAELYYEISNEGKIDKLKDGIIIYGMKLVGSVFDSLTTSVLASDNLYNNLPSIYVYAAKISESKINLNTIENSFSKIKVYTNILRQSYITSIPLHNNCGDKILPFIILDIGYDDQSRRQQKPVIPSLYIINNQTPMPDNTLIPISQLSTISGKTTYAKTNQTLSLIREASSERLPTPESQISFKPLSPKGTKLPTNLQLRRSRPLNTTK